MILTVSLSSPYRCIEDSVPGQPWASTARCVTVADPPPPSITALSIAGSLGAAESSDYSRNAVTSVFDPSVINEYELISTWSVFA